MIIEKEKIIEKLNKNYELECEKFKVDFDKKLKDFDKIETPIELLTFVQNNRNEFTFIERSKIIHSILSEKLDEFKPTFRESSFQMEKEGLTLRIDSRCKMITFVFEGEREPLGLVYSPILNSEGEPTEFWNAYKKYIENPTFSNLLSAAKLNVKDHLKGIRQFLAIISGFNQLKGQPNKSKWTNEEKKVLASIEKNKIMTVKYDESLKQIENEIIHHSEFVRELKNNGWSVYKEIMTTDEETGRKNSGNLTDFYEPIGSKKKK